jgi:hypothetical protein
MVNGVEARCRIVPIENDILRWWGRRHGFVSMNGSVRVGELVEEIVRGFVWGPDGAYQELLLVKPSDVGSADSLAYRELVRLNVVAENYLRYHSELVAVVETGTASIENVPTGYGSHNSTTPIPIAVASCGSANAVPEHVTGDTE